MNNIFSSIQQFFINVIAVITSVILVISPFDKPQPLSSPMPTVIQEVQEATPTATPATEVKGISTKENKVTPTPKPKILIPTSTPATIPTPSLIPRPPPILPQQVIQAPRVNIEAICQGYADELKATTRTMVGVAIYDSNPYYELTASRFYNYCLANNGNTSGFKVEPPPLPPPPLPTPIIVPDYSWQIESCSDTIKGLIANLEERKQKAINEAIVMGQNECVSRGYPPPDYIGCTGLIDQRIKDSSASFYDFQIQDIKLEYGCQ